MEAASACIFKQQVWSKKDMQISFALIAGDKDERSTLWVAKVLLFFHLNIQTDSSEIGYTFLRYIQCKPAISEVYKELAGAVLDCVVRKRKTIEQLGGRC